MSEKTSYKPGEFCWAELATSDWNAAKRFYTTLFKWVPQENPMGPDQPPYVMLKIGGRDAAALYENKETPPHWNVYVSVTNVDETAKKAKSLGATILAEPFDVMTFGRMAVIQDPQSAVLSLWQAKEHIGARVFNEPGAMCWNELYSPDIAASRKFYTDLFGWNLKVSDEYTEIHIGEQGTGGMMQIREEMKGMPPHWMPYFIVENCDATADAAKANGGQVHMGPWDIPNAGRIAILGDPQGASFAVIKVAM
jgi:predicted enzyme related to lactoylglutathione lyase